MCGSRKNNAMGRMRSEEVRQSGSSCVRTIATTSTRNEIREKDLFVQIKTMITLKLRRSYDSLKGCRISNIGFLLLPSSRRRLLRRPFHDQRLEKRALPLQVEYDRDSGIVTLFHSDGTTSSKQFFQSIIGLEIHAQLDIPTKLFSSAPTTTAYAAKFKKRSRTKSSSSEVIASNTLVSLMDMGYPGVLPLLSESAVQKAVLASAALNCQIHPISRFERKHYTYADLPLGYQITQQRWPLSTNGYLKCRNYHQTLVEDINNNNNNNNNNNPKNSTSAPISYFTVGIHRIQLEQDTGKTILSSHQKQLIDLNRAGCALIEIVFLPDIRSAHQAASVVATLQQVLKHIGVCDGKMEDGSLRCDLNISIAPITNTSPDNLDLSMCSKSSGNEYISSLPLNCGKRVEVKNLNSIRQIILATEYEACRQAKAYYDRNKNDNKVIEEEEETRTFDPSINQTLKIRSKKGAVDYRFLPEPDLPPLTLNDATVHQWIQELPELPEVAVSRLKEQYGLKDDVACVLVSNHPPLATIAFFEASVKYCLEDLQQEQHRHQKQHVTISSNNMEPGDVGPSVANWLCNDLFSLIKKSNIDDDDDASYYYIDQHQQQRNISRFFLISPKQFGSLVAMILDETISIRAGKNILSILCNHENIKDDGVKRQQQPREIADQRGWKLIKDMDHLRQICRQAVDENQKQSSQYLSAAAGSNTKLVAKIEKFLIGKAMSASQGNAHPDLLLDALRLVLSEAQSSKNM